MDKLKREIDEYLEFCKRNNLKVNNANNLQLYLSSKKRK